MKKTNGLWKKIYSHLDHFGKHMLKYIANDFPFINIDGQTALNEQTELLLKIPEYRNDNNSEDQQFNLEPVP